MRWELEVRITVPVSWRAPCRQVTFPLLKLYFLVMLISVLPVLSISSDGQEEAGQEAADRQDH